MLETRTATEATTPLGLTRLRVTTAPKSLRLRRLLAESSASASATAEATTTLRLLTEATAAVVWLRRLILEAAAGLAEAWSLRLAEAAALIESAAEAPTALRLLAEATTLRLPEATARRITARLSETAALRLRIAVGVIRERHRVDWRQTATLLRRTEPLRIAVLRGLPTAEPTAALLLRRAEW